MQGDLKQGILCSLSEFSAVHRTEGNGGVYFFDSSLTFTPTSQKLDISRAIAAESSPLYLANSRIEPQSYATLKHLKYTTVAVFCPERSLLILMLNGYRRALFRGLNQI